MRPASQGCACTCNFLTGKIFYLQLHAIFGMFNSHFSTNIIMCKLCCKCKLTLRQNNFEDVKKGVMVIPS